jgi:5-oxoprolinase (ATP-hydrolysing)
MEFIQDTAEQAVRNMLKSFYISRNLESHGGFVSAEDFLDDGTPIRLKVSINPEEGSAIFDFAGTGPEMYGNLNAPPAGSLIIVLLTLNLCSYILCRNLLLALPPS